MYKFFFIIHACAGKRKRKRSLGCARDDDTERAAPFLFISLREPASAPSGHLLPGKGGSMPPSRIVISSESEKSFSFAVKKRDEERGSWETPHSLRLGSKEGVCRLPASSFRAKARNLFRSRSDTCCEERDHGKHRTLCGVGSRCFMQTYVHRKIKTANEKDPSAALGMTIREQGCFLFFNPT